MKATLTSKGQVTIPKPIRDYLHLKKSDKIDFNISKNGKVYFEVKKHSISEFGGMLTQYKKEKPLNSEQMDEVIHNEAVLRNCK